MKHYGMAFHTIRFWQDQGKLLNDLIGYDAAVSGLAAYIVDATTPNHLAHYCIALAAIDPIRVKLLLSTGKATY
jgi:hypothetical protein